MNETMKEIVIYHLRMFPVARSNIKVWWICPICKNEYKASINHRKYGTGCPVCGIKKSNKAKMKPVNMIDLKTGEIIKTFLSISEASKEMKISDGNIGSVLHKKRKTAGGYGWQYAK